VSPDLDLTKQLKQKELAGAKGESQASSKSTSTSKDYLFTFVRVNFSDFHPGVLLAFPHDSTAAKNKHRRTWDVICARNKMKANILPKLFLGSLRIRGQFRRTKVTVQRRRRRVQHQSAVGTSVQMPLDLRLHSRRKSSL
jgi:hypothetical protein